MPPRNIFINLGETEVPGIGASVFPAVSWEGCGFTYEIHVPVWESPYLSPEGRV